MSRKRKCRYTPEELALHKEAVRLRNMTDKQLVVFFFGLQKSHALLFIR